MRKISLIFAAAALAFTLQAAMAVEGEECIVVPDDAPVYFAGRPGWHHRGPGGPGFEQGPGYGRGPGGWGGRRAGGFGFGAHRGMHAPWMATELDLTDAQKNQFVDVMTANFRERLVAVMEVQAARAKVRDLRDAEKPDAEAIIAANTALGAARGRLDVVEDGLRDRIRAILTPEQAAKLDEFRRERESRREERFERRGRDDDDVPSPQPQRMHRRGRRWER